MTAIARHLTAVALAAAIIAPGAQAASWQDQLSAAATQLSQGNGTQQDAGSLASLLTGGTQALAAGSMPNVAGVFEYCVKQKLLVATDPENVRNQLLDKLGLSTPQEQSEKPGYLEGLTGLLNTRNGQQINLNTLSNSGIGKKIKLKACDVILNQSLSFIS